MRATWWRSRSSPAEENDAQLHAILYAVGTLRDALRGHPDVYVSGDLLIYLRGGQSAGLGRARCVRGVRGRGSGAHELPRDVKTKPGVYAGLGVKEYFLYDPRGEYLTPRLQGFRLAGSEYERLTAVESIDRTLTMRSETLGLELKTRRGELHSLSSAPGQSSQSTSGVLPARIRKMHRCDDIGTGQRGSWNSTHPHLRNSRYAGFSVSSRYSYPSSSRNDWKSPRSSRGTCRPISTRP